MVCSTDDKEREVVVPIKAFGKNEFDKDKDAFGIELDYKIQDGNIKLKVKPHTSYIFQV